MTETMLAPAAYWMGTPKIRVSAGTTRIPPPTPTREPMKPANIEIRNIPRRYSNIPIMWCDNAARDAVKASSLVIESDDFDGALRESLLYEYLDRALAVV